jgi:hypothetical protein
MKKVLYNQPWRLKPYHELPCPNNLNDIKKEVLDWLEKNTDYLTDKNNPHTTRYVNFVDLAKHCPSVIKYAKELKVPLIDIQFIIAPAIRTVPVGLHAGEDPQNIKLNIPILNTDEAYITEWYDIPHEILESMPTYREPYWADIEKPMVDLRQLEDTIQDCYPLAGRYCMVSNPIVFNAAYPHRVNHVDWSNAKWPRVVMSLIPADEHSLTPFLEKN